MKVLKIEVISEAKRTNRKARNTENKEAKMFKLRRAINDMVKGGSYIEYRNLVIADAVANGHGEKLTEDWLRKVLLMDVEDGIATYEEVLAVKDDYMKAIEQLKRMA